MGYFSFDFHPSPRPPFTHESESRLLTSRLWSRFISAISLIYRRFIRVGHVMYAYCFKFLTRCVSQRIVFPTYCASWLSHFHIIPLKFAIILAAYPPVPLTPVSLTSNVSLAAHETALSLPLSLPPLSLFPPSLSPPSPSPIYITTVFFSRHLVVESINFHHEFYHTLLFNQTSTLTWGTRRQLCNAADDYSYLLTIHAPTWLLKNPELTLSR